MSHPAASDLDLHCVHMYHKKDAQLIWLNENADILNHSYISKNPIFPPESMEMSGKLMAKVELHGYKIPQLFYLLNNKNTRLHHECEYRINEKKSISNAY